MSITPVDLKARAHQAMLDAGFHPDVPAEVAREVQNLKLSPAAPNGSIAPPGGQPNASSAPRDLRGLLWSSIDNDSSRDLDQVEYVEKTSDGAVRLLVGIADVDVAVPRGSAMDRQAAAESTSVYTGVATFPMLPAELSTNLTSLMDAQDRLAVVVEMRVLDSGDVECHDVFPALLRNRAKLAYPSTGAWLEGRGPIPPAAAAVPGMEEQLRLQHETADKLRGLRRQHGALAFASSDAEAVVQNGEVKDLAVSRQNAAEDIIESFMVAANVAIALFLKEKGALSIRRVVRRRAAGTASSRLLRNLAKTYRRWLSHAPCRPSWSVARRRTPRISPTCRSP